jgi:hypothetical protein
MDWSIAKVALPLVLFCSSLHAQSQVAAQSAQPSPARPVPSSENNGEPPPSCGCACLNDADLFGFAVCFAASRSIVRLPRFSVPLDS